MVRHRNHISYLLHTIRVFYDQFSPKSDEDHQRKRLIHKFDKYGLSPERIKKHCVIGETVAQRLKDADAFWNEIKFQVIYPATLHSNFREPKEWEFVFLPGRLHRMKRVDMAIKAMKYLDGIKLLIAGEGEDEDCTCCGDAVFVERAGIGRHALLDDGLDTCGGMIGVDAIGPVLPPL